MGSLRFLNSFVYETCLVIPSLSVLNVPFYATCRKNDSWSEILCFLCPRPRFSLPEDITNNNNKKKTLHGNEAQSEPRVKVVFITET